MGQLDTRSDRRLYASPADNPVLDSSGLLLFAKFGEVASMAFEPADFRPPHSQLGKTRRDPSPREMVGDGDDSVWVFDTALENFGTEHRADLVRDSSTARFGLHMDPTLTTASVNVAIGGCVAI